ncbi:MAG: hypothetical protein Q9225_005477, partial [Loekoesia sp. 1 TL-2023]
MVAKPVVAKYIQVTALETSTITIGHIWKRDSAATITNTIGVEPEPDAYSYNYVSSAIAGADRNATIASSVYSACSCLHLSPKTVSRQSTVGMTRTISGFNAETEYAATVTAAPPHPPPSPLSAPPSPQAAAPPSTTQSTPSPPANNTKSNATAPTAALSPSASTNPISATAYRNARSSTTASAPSDATALPGS